MQDGLPQFGRTIRIDAAVIHLAFRPHNLGSTHRTLLRHFKFFKVGRTRMVFIINHLRHFRNYIPAALHLHPVANLHAQALDLIHVVQRGISHRCAAD